MPMNFALVLSMVMDKMESRKNMNNKAPEGASKVTKRGALPGIVLGLFLVIFVSHLMSWNRSDDSYSSYELKVNQQQVAAAQKGDVASVEKEISRMDASLKSGDSASGKRAWYMERFRNCVVVGDSLTEGLSVYQWLSKKQVFSSVGASLINDEKLFKKAAATYPKAAFFAFGMNDMGNYRGNEKSFIARYKKLLAGVHKKSPKTEIYICSISTPTKGAIKRKKVLKNYKKFNKAIEEMCKKEGYTYVDGVDILPKHKSLYAGDGIHAASAYYPMWMDRMIEEADL